MGRNKTYEDEKQQRLFILPESQPLGPKIKRIHNPVWTENKARLIERYLNLFVIITKHGTYVDAFAGPQEPEKPEMWAAKLVLESEPMWLQHFYLFESDKTKVEQLQALEQTVPKVWKDGTKREVRIYPGDSNVGIHELLESHSIRQTEATFCLLDQRTFECEWQTLESLASYKNLGNKIELFYFLANSWLDRAIAAQKDTEKLCVPSAIVS